LIDPGEAFCRTLSVANLVNPLLKCWHLVEFAAARTLLFTLGVAPLPVVLGIAGFAARVAFLVWRPRRRVAINNLLQAGVCADKRAARRLAFISFRAFTVMIAETIVARRRIRADNWQEFVTLKLAPEAEDLFHEPGRGLLIASAHLGNWEVAARAVSMIKPLCVAYRPFNNPLLNQAAHKTRSGERLRLVSRLDTDPMRFIEALAAGEIVAVMIDQHAAKARVAVDFFGRPAWTTRSVAMMHLTTRAPLLVACAIRTGPLRYEAHAVGPISVARTGNREKDVLAITQALTSEIEKLARRYPEQYMWGHRRWK
jgi:KDO2-lipid IV(A) lauroyltransferase